MHSIKVLNELKQELELETEEIALPPGVTEHDLQELTRQELLLRLRQRMRPFLDVPERRVILQRLID